MRLTFATLMSHASFGIREHPEEPEVEERPMLPSIPDCDVAGCSTVNQSMHSTKESVESAAAQDSRHRAPPADESSSTEQVRCFLLLVTLVPALFAGVWWFAASGAGPVCRVWWLVSSEKWQAIYCVHICIRMHMRSLPAGAMLF